MAKRSEQMWEIYRLTGLRSIGQVNAPDEEKAVKIAIKELLVPPEAISRSKS